MPKKAKKDKREKKDKRDKKDRKRKRDTDSSDSGGQEAQRRRDKEVERLTKALNKGNDELQTDEDGVLQPGKFVWKKKFEKEIQEGKRVKDIYEREKRNTEAERKAEIEKVQKRREEREREKEERELEQEQLGRDRAAAEAMDLERREDEFHLENAKARARHRLKEEREKPIDVLVRDLMLHSDFEVGADPPYQVFSGLPLQDMQDLREDILEYKELDSEDSEHAAWWDSLLTVCEEELKEAEMQRELDRAHHRGERQASNRKQREVGVHSSVDLQIQSLLSGQRYSELVELEEELRNQLEGNTAPDPEFTTAILRRMVLHKAKALLRELHSSLLARSLAKEDSKVDVPVAMGWRDEPLSPAKAVSKELKIVQYLYREPEKSAATPGSDEEPAAGPASPGPPDVGLEQPEEAEPEAPNVGQWSPAPLVPEEFAGGDVVPEEDDLRTLQLLRVQMKKRAASSFGAGPRQTNGAPSAPATAEAAGEEAAAARFLRQAAGTMGEMTEAGDAPFGGEVHLESRVYWWHEKYRPRKPKYFNRVHTGYEWNKYNQTHYDHDNPPPKVVQGYKFNIFYPDTIDKKAAPEYSVEKDPEADEFGSTCVLRFHAGPPYEDLTFRILNREWEYSHKKGFKCVFDRDTLYLYFNFKRQRYRR